MGFNTNIHSRCNGIGSRIELFTFDKIALSSITQWYFFFQTKVVELHRKIFSTSLQTRSSFSFLFYTLNM